MAWILRGNLKGPTGTFHSVTAETLPSGATATATISGPLAERAVTFGIPEGPQGLPGTGAVPADAAVAGYISTGGTSATKTALAATVADAAPARQVASPGLGDATGLLQAAIDAAIAAGESQVRLARNGVYRTSAPLELSGSSTVAERVSVTLVGPAVIKPLSTFAGSDVVRHTQTSAQATADSFGYGAGLQNIEIDGTDLVAANVNGIRLDGAFMPKLSVFVHHVTGHGMALLADNTIDPTTDDTYACPGLSVDGSKFTSNSGWGIYQSRFAAPMTCRDVYVNNNSAGGVRITAPNVTWDGGAIAYNGGVGLHFALSTSAVTSTLSTAHFRGVEIDRNTGVNVWFESAFNCTLELPRLITAETGATFNGGAYIAPVMVKFGGTAGQSAFNVRIIRPYIRASQQTTNPPLTLFEFTAQATDCEVQGMYELVGSSSARVVGARAGSRNRVTTTTGSVAFGVGDTQSNGLAQVSLTNATSATTALVDVVFNSTTTDALARYDTATGVYDCGQDNGLFVVSGFLTVAAAAATTERTVTVHLRVDPGTGTYSSLKTVTVQVAGVSKAQTVPFSFRVPVTTANAKLKVAVVASTGTALQVGATTSELTVYKAA